jgi:hypothetical protein
LLRTHKTRPFGGALILIIMLVVSLCFGALGMSAVADDTNPSSTQTADQANKASGSGLAASLLAGPDPTVVGEYFVLKRGRTESLDVRANDTCSSNPHDTCTYSAGAFPAGWGMSITPEGTMTIWVPGATAPGLYPVGYTVAHGSASATGAVSVAVTSDDYGAPAGMIFTHPYRKGHRTLIRTHILRTINSVPSGARIQVASWSFSSKAYNQALYAALARGVIVQIVLAQRNTIRNSDYRTLTRMFGTTVTPDGSWVRRCTYSCRGTGGTMHSKIFLFSQAYRTPFITMTGSANLTDFAVTNQWNQMNTVSGDQAVYNEAVGIFTQMEADQPVNPPYVETHYPNLTTYYYPRGAVTQANDFMMHALAPVRCKGAVNAGKGGRTIVKIAMYAWYQRRGKWLAKRVRQLWQQGCQVQIIYGISSNPVKSILYSPAGRGRIPMRQILLTNTKGTPIYYVHDKWVTITGNYAGVPNNSVSFQGSFNFADYGFSSDEQFQMIPGRATYNQFARDFGLLWKDRQARAPSPVSQIPVIEGRYTQDDLRLGTGVYRYMESD